jgi:arylsulfatase A-like enzyme
MQDKLGIMFIQACLTNMRDRTKEEDYFAPRVLKEAALWLEQNQDADKIFLTVESFDPHEPWLVPKHYQKMYMQEEGQEQVRSGYRDTSKMKRALVRRTQANYSGEVTMCDRWFGYFMDNLRVLGMLDNSIIIFTSDHGHSVGDARYLGKRGYPSAPEVFDVPLMVRFPKAKYAGRKSDILVQHHDISAEVLRLAGAKSAEKIDGRPFLNAALRGGKGARDHVTVGWGTAATVVTQRWWFNCKVDGTGVLLHDLKSARPFAKNVAKKHPKVASKLFALAEKDARDGFPEWLMDLARKQADAPGCSALAARE